MRKFYLLVQQTRHGIVNALNGFLRDAAVLVASCFHEVWPQNTPYLENWIIFTSYKDYIIREYCKRKWTLTPIIWIKGLPLFTHFSITSPKRARSNTFISFSLGLFRLHQNLLLSLYPSVVLKSCALLALQRAVRNEQSALRFSLSAASSKSLSTCCDSTQIILAA